jgi:hypothetical protein
MPRLSPFVLPVALFLGAIAHAAEARVWKFEKLAPDWVREGSSPDAPKEAVSLAGGKVAITARANTWDRVKITTVARDFGTGTYTWVVNVPAMGMNDMASIGAFIYRDDQHELDFEIGSGTAALRKKHGAAPDELLCYCTNQKFPFSSSIFKIKGGAKYTLKLELLPRAGGKLLARWSVDGKQLTELATELPADTKFGIHCSVENLKFLGDHQPKRTHTATFESVSFTPYSAPSPATPAPAAPAAKSKPAEKAAPAAPAASTR